MKVTIVIPTLNEEETIGDVIERFKKLGYSDILVIDGKSSDRTREIAAEKGARVVIQSGEGKGQAIAEAFTIVDSDVVVIIDGDGTYMPEEVDKLLNPIRNDKADHVVGNRFAGYEEGAFTKLNLVGNKILNTFFRFIYGVELHDILSGYRALKKEVYKNVELKKLGFEIETELTVETLVKGFRILEVPITYKRRSGRAKLRPIRDGIRIGKTIYELLKRYSPARYLYFVGVLFLIFGFASGIYVVIEWYRRITHYLLATLTTLLILSGLQLLMFGIISDFIFRSNTEFRRELIKIRDHLKREKSNK